MEHPTPGQISSIRQLLEEDKNIIEFDGIKFFKELDSGSVGYYKFLVALFINNKYSELNDQIKNINN